MKDSTSATERTPAKYFNLSIREVDHRSLKEISSIEHSVDSLMATTHSRRKRQVNIYLSNQWRHCL